MPQYDYDGRLIPSHVAQQKRQQGILQAIESTRATALSCEPPLIYDIPSNIQTFTKNKVMIIRVGGLGDVLCVTPLIRTLSSVHELIVDVKTDHPSVFVGNPYVNRVISENEHFDTQQYDAVVDLCGYVERPENLVQHRPRAFAKSAGITIDIGLDYLDYYVSKEEERWANHFLSDYFFTGAPGPVAYIWKTSTDNRNWSINTHQAVLRSLYKLAVEMQFSILILDPRRQQIPLRSEYEFSIHNLTGMHSVRETAAIMSRCKAVISPDTGAFHLANALRVPTLSYFGSFPLEERATFGDVSQVNTPQDCKLFPCRSYSCPMLGSPETDSQSPCLNVDPGRVSRMLRTILTR